MKHLTADPDLDRVPRAYRPIVRRALAKDPEHRYSNVHDLLSHLESARLGVAAGDWAPVTATVVETPFFNPERKRSLG